MRAVRAVPALGDRIGKAPSPSLANASPGAPIPGANRAFSRGCNDICGRFVLCRPWRSRIGEPPASLANPSPGGANSGRESSVFSGLRCDPRPDGWKCCEKSLKRQNQDVGTPVIPAKALRDAHITLRGARTPSPALCWGRWLAEPAGWGVARCCEAGRLARPQERTFDDAFLLSTPHPSGFARHPRVFARGQALPRFAEKGARNRLMFGRKRLPHSSRSWVTQMCASRSAKAGIQTPGAGRPRVRSPARRRRLWMPAFAGMTTLGVPAGRAAAHGPGKVGAIRIDFRVSCVWASKFDAIVGM